MIPLLARSTAASDTLVFSEGKAKDKFGALSRAVARNAHLSMVEINEALHQRQTQSETTPAAVQAALGLHEALENARQDFGLDPDPRVLDRNRDAVPVLCQADGYLPPRVGELERVMEQV